MKWSKSRLVLFGLLFSLFGCLLLSSVKATSEEWMDAGGFEGVYVENKVYSIGVDEFMNNPISYFPGMYNYTCFVDFASMTVAGTEECSMWVKFLNSGNDGCAVFVNRNASGLQYGIFKTMIDFMPSGSYYSYAESDAQFSNMTLSYNGTGADFWCDGVHQLSWLVGNAVLSEIQASGNGTEAGFAGSVSSTFSYLTSVRFDVDSEPWFVNDEGFGAISLSGVCRSGGSSAMFVPIYSASGTPYKFGELKQWRLGTPTSLIENFTCYAHGSGSSFDGFGDDSRIKAFVVYTDGTSDNMISQAFSTGWTFLNFTGMIESGKFIAYVGFTPYYPSQGHVFIDDVSMMVDTTAPVEGVEGAYDFGPMMNVIAALLVIFGPAVALLVIIPQARVWGFLAGMTVGVSLGYLYLGAAVIPAWMIFAVAIIDVAAGFTSLKGGF